MKVIHYQKKINEKLLHVNNLYIYLSAVIN